MNTAFDGEADRLLAGVEALTAIVLNRAGMPWDAMAARVECSKQALHRRHAQRGEALFEEANSRFGGQRSRTTDVRALIDSLHDAEDMIDDGDFDYLDVENAI